MKIMVVSLKKSLDRREYIEQQLGAQNIDFEFFDAVDGSDKSNPILGKYNYCKRRWLTSGKYPTNGEVGCYASHYSLWKLAASNNEPMVIIEDDTPINDGSKAILDFVAKNIEEFGFIRLEKPHRGELIQVLDEGGAQIYWMSDNFGGLRAYAVAPWAAQKLLDKSQSWSFPVDNYVGYNFIHKVESYQMIPYIAGDEHPLETTIQFYAEVKTPLYVKPTRELYTLYRKIRKLLHTFFVKSRMTKSL